MSSFRHFLLPSLCLCFALTGCGSAPIPAPSAAAPFDATGNWVFDFNLNIQEVGGILVPPTNPITIVSGALTSSGKSVSAVLHADSLKAPYCVDIDTALPLTGTTDSSGNVTLTGPIAGGVATLSANLLTPQSTLGQVFSGSYQVVGGPCAQTTIALNIFKVPNITGTSTGIAQPINSTGLSSTITATFVEASAPDANGVYPLSGTITSTGGCNTTYTFSSGAVSGNGARSTYFISDTFAANPPYPLPVFVGSILPNGSGIIGSFNSSTCSSSYQFTLSLSQ